MRSPEQCVARLREGQRLFVRSGTPQGLADRLAALADPGTPLADFDPADPSTATEHFDVGDTTAVATDGEQVVILQNRARGGRVPSFPGRASAEFLVGRLGGPVADVPIEALDALRPAPRDGCQELLAHDQGGRAEVRVILRGLPFSDSFTDRGRRSVGDGLIGAVSFGEDLDGTDCADVAGPPSTTTVTWPLADGTTRYRIRPSWSRCLDVTVQLRALAVEQPDGTRVVIPDLTIRNRTFGVQAGSGTCLYPAP